MGVCETSMPDVMAPEAHQNDRSYVRELSRPTSIQLSMVGGYTKDLKKSLNCQNWGVGACTRMGACPGQSGI